MLLLVFCLSCSDYSHLLFVVLNPRSFGEYWRDFFLKLALCSSCLYQKLEQWVVGVVMSGARCRLHMAQVMPLPLTVSCFSKIQISFTFLVLAYPGRPGKGPLNGCVCVSLYQQCQTTK